MVVYDIDWSDYDTASPEIFDLVATDSLHKRHSNMIIAIRKMFKGVQKEMDELDASTQNDGKAVLDPNLERIPAPKGYENVPPQYCHICKTSQLPEFFVEKPKDPKRLGRIRSKLQALKKKDQASNSNHNESTQMIKIKCSTCHNNMVLVPKGADSTYNKPDRSEAPLQ